MVTVPGGQTINTPGLSQLQQQQLADGLAKLAGEGFSSSNIITNINQAPVTTPGVLNVYDVPGKAGGTFTLPNGGQVLVVTGTKDVNVVGSTSGQIIAAGSGDDTFSSGGMGKQGSIMIRPH